MYWLVQPFDALALAQATRCAFHGLIDWPATSKSKARQFRRTGSDLRAAFVGIQLATKSNCPQIGAQNLRMYSLSFLIFCLFTAAPLLAQEKAGGVSGNTEPMSSFQAVNVSVDTLLQEYEQLTGNVLIKDSSLAANALPISISVPKPVPRTELVRIIESVLLLNNFALIPGPEPKTVKVINMNTGKNPRSEGLPLYTSPAWPLRR